MADPIITRPLAASDELLPGNFHEDIARQSDRMDDLTRHLITVELAIPGLYVAVLQLVGDQPAVLTIGPSHWITFVFWFVSLMLALFALVPRRYDVDTDVLSGMNL